MSDMMGLIPLLHDYPFMGVVFAFTALFLLSKLPHNVLSFFKGKKKEDAEAKVMELNAQNNIKAADFENRLKADELKETYRKEMIDILIKERDDNRKQHKEDIEALNNKIDKLNSEIMELKVRIETLSNIVHEKDTMLITRESCINLKDHEIHLLRDYIGTLTAKINKSYPDFDCGIAPGPLEERRAF